MSEWDSVSFLINHTRPNLDVLKDNTDQNIVSECMIKSDFESLENPNRYGIFQGVDGKWYFISKKSTFGNCYSTAMGWTYSAPNKYWYIPGFTIGKAPRYVSQCTQYVIKDLETLGRHVYEVIDGDKIPTKLPPAGNGRYWIKVMRSHEESINGFHIARKDEKSGRWIHQTGWDDQPKVFMRNLEIDYAYDEISTEFNLRDMIKRNGSKEFFEEFILIMHGDTVPKTISKWEYETMDNASYMAYIPEINENDFTEYKPMHALLID